MPTPKSELDRGNKFERILEVFKGPTNFFEDETKVDTSEEIRVRSSSFLRATLVHHIASTEESGYVDRRLFRINVVQE